MNGLRATTLVGTVLATVVLAASPAAAFGGWATSSLDPMPVPAAGEAVTVGFTIRQHGVTPTNPDEEAGVTVEVVIRSPSGDQTAVPARQEGATGHYVAEVTFPEAGRASWAINQGWFGPYDLGPIEVAEAPGSPAPSAPADPAESPAPRWPAPVRAGAVVVACAAAAVAVTEAVRRWRRPAGTVGPWAS